MLFVRQNYSCACNYPHVWLGPAKIFTGREIFAVICPPRPSTKRCPSRIVKNFRSPLHFSLGEIGKTFELMKTVTSAVRNRVRLASPEVIADHPLANLCNKFGQI